MDRDATLLVRDLDCPPGMDRGVWGRVLSSMGDEVIVRFAGESALVDPAVLARLADQLGLYVPELDEHMAEAWTEDLDCWRG